MSSDWGFMIRRNNSGHPVNTQNILLCAAAWLSVWISFEYDQILRFPSVRSCTEEGIAVDELASIFREGQWRKAVKSKRHVSHCFPHVHWFPSPCRSWQSERRLLQILLIALSRWDLLSWEPCVCACVCVCISVFCCLLLFTFSFLCLCFQGQEGTVELKFHTVSVNQLSITEHLS